MEKLLLVCAGGAAGSGLRYLLSGWVTRLAGGAFPAGTLAVNLIGSFLIGAIMVVGLETTAISPLTRITLTTGVMGGFTTFSTFSYETVTLLQEGSWLLAGVNVGVSVLGCLVACALGVATGRWLVAP